MDIVVPLRVEGLGCALGPEPMRLVGSVFQHQVDGSVFPGARAHALRDLGQEVDLAVILYRVHRIEAQTVEVILFQPVENVVYEELADRAAVGPVVVDSRAPRSVMTLGEELACVGMKIVSLWPEVVVNHVQHHCDSAPM